MLDVACGLNLLACKFAESYGIDIQDYGDTDLVVNDFTDLPFDTASFETITIVASLNYFEDPPKVFAECGRILKPDGRIILTVLETPAVGKIWHRFREPWARRSGFSRDQLEGITRQASLRVVQKKSFMLGLNNLYVLMKSET